MRPSLEELEFLSRAAVSGDTDLHLAEREVLGPLMCRAELKFWNTMPSGSEFRQVGLRIADRNGLPP